MIVFVAAVPMTDLQELITIEEILVNITGSGETICAGNNGTTTRVTFFSQYGSLSNITTDMFTLASSTSTPSVSVFAKGQVRVRGGSCHLFR